MASPFEPKSPKPEGTSASATGTIAGDAGIHGDSHRQISDYRPGQLRAFIELMKKETGNDPELVRQAVADLNALERQTARNNFEARIRYVNDIVEAERVGERGLFEYGLQTLKWLFLLNAGAIGIVVAFVGGMMAKSPSTSGATALIPLMKSLWPFAVGCVLVTLSGAAGYFSFSYASAMLPSAEALHNFLNPAASLAWPLAKLQRPDETNAEFWKRIGWRLNTTRYVAIAFAFGSALCFAYGVYRVLRTVLGASF